MKCTRRPRAGVVYVDVASIFESRDRATGTGSDNLSPQTGQQLRVHHPDGTQSRAHTSRSQAESQQCARHCPVYAYLRLTSTALRYPGCMSGARLPLRHAAPAHGSLPAPQTQCLELLGRCHATLSGNSTILSRLRGYDCAVHLSIARAGSDRREKHVCSWHTSLTEP